MAPSSAQPSATSRRARPRWRRRCDVEPINLLLACRCWARTRLPAAGPPRSGSAWLGRSQKDGLAYCSRGGSYQDARPSARAQGRGSPVAAPFNRDSFGARAGNVSCARAITDEQRRGLFVLAAAIVGGAAAFPMVARMTRTARPTPNFVILDESLPDVGRLVAVMLRARQAIESRSSVVKR